MSDPGFTRTKPLMGTLVTINVVRRSDEAQTSSTEVQSREQAIEQAINRAFAWFASVEACCTRFNPQSELMRLVAAPVGEPVPASPTLFQAVQFALAVAEASGGAFDPTVGKAMETRGFNREYSTRKTIHTSIGSVESSKSDAPVSYRDIRLDPERKTITLLRPLILDLGAVAKGLAIDLAAHELQPFENFAIDAGGDLYLGGRNPKGDPWSVGIRHPRRDNELIDSIRVSNRAVCTSGDYERPAPGEAEGHHILDPRTGTSPQAVASVTVVAPTALLADAVATAAFVLGPIAGTRLFDHLGVDGLIISPNLEQFATRGMSGDYQLGSSAILPHAQRPAHDHPGDSGRARRAV